MTLKAITYNNPGDVSLPIAGWTGGGSVVGISGQDGYASFPDMQTGYAAMQQRVTNYIDNQGLDTIAKMNNSYARDPNWGNNVSTISGIGLNDKLDAGNPGQMSALNYGIIRAETQMSPSALGIDNTQWASGSPSFDSGSPKDVANPNGSLPSAADSGGAFGVSGPNYAAAGAGATGATGALPPFPLAVTPKNQKLSRVADVGTHGAQIITGHPTISTNDRNHARIGDLVNCPLHGVNPIIAVGAGSVVNGNQKAAHVSAVTKCGAHIITGSEDIIIDGK